ncbi:hypothetical protein D3C78_1291540 [compost metagenome]
MPGKLDPAVDQEGVGRHPVMALEGSAQVGRRQLRGGADVFELQGFAAMVVDELRRPHQPRMAAPVRATGRVEPLLQVDEKRLGGSVLVGGVELRVHQLLIQLPQRGKQFHVAAVRGGEALEIQVFVKADTALQVSEPLGVDVQHHVGPRLIVDRVARVDVAGVHQYHRAALHLEVRAFVKVGAAPSGDRTDGKVVMGMARVADLAPVADGPGFDEGQGRVAPEAWGVVMGGVLHRSASSS